MVVVTSKEGSEIIEWFEKRYSASKSFTFVSTGRGGTTACVVSCPVKVWILMLQERGGNSLLRTSFWEDGVGPFALLATVEGCAYPLTVRKKMDWRIGSVPRAKKMPKEC
jgi:hypothetical protein